MENTQNEKSKKHNPLETCPDDCNCDDHDVYGNPIPQPLPPIGESEEKCYLEYVEGYLTCTYNHKIGEECLLNDREDMCLHTDGTPPHPLSEDCSYKQDSSDSTWEADYEKQFINLVTVNINSKLTDRKEEVKSFIKGIEAKARETERAKLREMVKGIENKEQKDFPGIHYTSFVLGFQKALSDIIRSLDKE